MKKIRFQKAINKGVALISPSLKLLKKHLSLLNSVILLMLILVLVLQKNTPKTVVFSKGLAITSFAKELNDKGVSDARQRLLVNRFISALPNALAQYAQKHRVVVLNDKEVVAGAPNITPYVLAYIATEMTQQNQGSKRHG
jgi:type-F conjugative transfer system protein TrbI